MVNEHRSGKPGRGVRLLLISPRFPESFWSFRFAISEILPDKRALNPPLGLATLAALCPSDWVIHIVDENVESLPLTPDVDVVGICGMGVQFTRQTELLRYYRQRGYYVVAGGSYASLCPERYTELANTVIAGEAERIWPTFCHDFTEDKPVPLYCETDTVDITTSPTPRFDLLKLDRYTTVSMQFSRGCPYRCEFCDIIVMFGRIPRTKTMSQIGYELDRLRESGIKKIFFVDDNLIGNKAKAKELLIYLREYQHTHKYYFNFGTEASLNLSENRDLIQLFREANFGWVFVGIESPDEASLKEIKKVQNLRVNMLESVQTLYRNGIDVLAGFIVGFDNDTLDTFDRQRQFIMSSGIQVAMVGLLMALPKTPLYSRLKKEGRLIEKVHDGDNTQAASNVWPLRMSYDDMVNYYKHLYQELQSNAGIGLRIESKMRYLKAPVHQVQYTVKQRLVIFRRLFFKGILPGNLKRLGWFLRTLIHTRPSVWHQVITDWIMGLAMRDYMDRHFAPATARDKRLISQTLNKLRHIGRHGLHQGTLDLTVSLEKNLILTLRGCVDKRFLSQAGKRLENLLHQSATTITLHIESLSEEQRKQLQRMLRRLSRYGDRIFIHLNEGLRQYVQVDSSVFNVVMD